MDRIVLKHLSGSKRDQVDELAIADHPEVSLGRDPDSTVSYDPQQDDLVSRQQARIARDPNDPLRWILHDLGSRNGTFVNKQRVSGQVALTPGDVVQFGAGGPEFQFDLDPRPNVPPATREADIPVVAPPPTRETATVPPATSTSTSTSTATPGRVEPAKVGVGKETLEREITRAKSDTRGSMMWGGAALAGAAALLIGFVAWNNRTSQDALNNQLKNTENQLVDTRKSVDDAKKTAADEKANSYLTASEVAKKVVPSVVFIKMSWKLIDTESGGIVYHQYLSGKDGKRMAAYVLNQDGSYQPWLTLDAQGNKPIGSAGGGSGFVVSDDGFILTNRHVAAPWYAPLTLPAGVVIQPSQENGKLALKIVGTVDSGPQNWVPADAMEGNERRSLTGKSLEGRNDYLEVTFPREKNDFSARLVTPSKEHDVALIRIDRSGLTPLELNPAPEEAEQGKPMIVIGYPFGGQLGAGMTAVQDKSGSNKSKVIFVAEPTVTTGTVARVIDGGDNPLKYVNVAGDVYQHTAGTNPGNSGGPVCDYRGRVIAVHYAGMKDVQGANFAVPIRYGIKLMGKDAVTISSDDDAKTDDARPDEPAAATREASQQP